MKTKPVRPRRYWVWPQRLRDGDPVVCETRPISPGQICVLISPIKPRTRTRRS